MTSPSYKKTFFLQNVDKNFKSRFAILTIEYSETQSICAHSHLKGRKIGANIVIITFLNIYISIKFKSKRDF